MRTVLSFVVLALTLSLGSPASAQMCGGGQNASSATSGGQNASSATSGGMCGSMGQRVADDPMADKPAQPQQSGMMCGCCRNMAMMGGQQGNQSMPGMDMPKQ